MAIKIDAQLGRLPGQVRSRTIASLRKEGPDPLAMPGSNYLGIAEKYDKNISEEVKNVIVAYDTAKINRDVAKQNMLLKRSKYLVDQLVGKNLGKIQLEIERKVSLKTLAEGTITKEELLKKFRDSNIKGLDAFDPSVSGDARIHYYLHQGSYEAALEAYYDTHVIQDFQQDVVKEITEYHDAVSNGKLPFYPNKDNKVLSEDAKRFVNEYRMKSSEFVDTMTALEMDEIELGNKIIKREDLEKHLLAKHFISSNRDKYITDQGYVKYSEMAKTELNKEYGEEEKKYIKAELTELTKIQTEEVQNSNSELTMGLIDAYKSKDANKKNEAWESFIANYIHLPGTNQQQTTKALKGLGDFITKGFTDKALTTDQEIIQRDVKEQFYKGNITVHNVYKAEGEDDSQAKSILERFIEGSIDESFFLAAVTYQQTDDKKNILTSLEDKVENQFAPEFENLITGKGGDYEYLYSQNSLSQLRKLAYVKNIVHDTIMDLILDANVDPIKAEEIIKEQLNLGNPDSILNKMIDKWAATSDNMDFSFKEMLGKEDRGKKPFIRQNREIKIKTGDGAVVDVTPELLLQLKEMYLKKDPIEQFKMEKELQKRTGEENILELMGIN